MEIESFEPYHIGTKLRPQLDPASITNLKSIVGEKEDYEIIPEHSFYRIPIFDIARKGTASIQINLDSNAINAIGNDRKEVIEVFEDLIGFLTKLGIDIASSVSFYEIISTVSIRTDKNPLDVLKSKINVQMDIFKQFSVSITGLKFSTTEITDENELFELLIGPKAISPKEKYFMNVFIRSRDLKRIKELNNGMEESVEKFINLLEDDI